MKLNKYLLGAVLLIVIGGVYYYLGQKDQDSPNSMKSSGQIAQGVQIGNAAPVFTLKTLDGRSIKLSDFRGQKVLLNFWATWCPPCKAEVPEFERFYQEHHKENIEILAVDIFAQEKGKEVVENFIKDYSMTYPVVLDESGSVANTYRVSAIPTTYVIDTKGIITHKVTGAMSYQALQDALAKIN